MLLWKSDHQSSSKAGIHPVIQIWLYLLSRLQADTFRWKRLLKLSYLAHSKGLGVIFMKQKSKQKQKQKMEKSKFWWRNDGFSFVPEVKVTLQSDWNPMVFLAGISMRPVDE